MSENIKFEYKLLHQSIEKMDDDLALLVVLSGLSNDPKKIIKQFSVASQIMITRLNNKETLTEYEKKLLETTSYTFSGIYKNLDSSQNS